MGQRDLSLFTVSHVIEATIIVGCTHCKGYEQNEEPGNDRGDDFHKLEGEDKGLN